MIRTTFLLALLIIPCPAFSQDYMTTIAEKSCACLEKIETPPDSEDFNMQLGLCMLEAATPYKEQINKDHNINLENIDVEGERLGRIIGLKMAGVCPTILVKLTQKTKAKDAEANELSTRGLITKIESDFFVAFSLKEEGGKVNKYLWLTHIDTDEDLITSYLSLKGKKVNVTYIPREFFDPRIKEYRQVFVLTKIELDN